MDWEVVKARRRGYAESYAVGTILATFVLAGWATAVGPTGGSGANALYDALLDTGPALLRTALALWLGSLLIGSAAWDLAVMRPRFRGASGPTWVRADRFTVLASAAVTALAIGLANSVPALDVVVRTGAELGDTSFVINPAGAAARFIILGALLAYASAAGLAVASDWTEGRAKATQSATA